MTGYSAWFKARRQFLLMVAAFTMISGALGAGGGYGAEAQATAAPLKPMAADVDPSFEVATIKPNHSGVASIMGMGMNGRDFAMKNASVIDLIAFAYGIQAKQIVNGHGWMENERYDIAGVPEQEGVPNARQVRAMIQKLLSERFELSVHHEKRELSAFVMTKGKSGPKLTPTKLSGSLSLIGGFRPGPAGITLSVQNITMEGFAHLMQMAVLDRPVMDQTGVRGSFDFQLMFTPDDSEFHGHPPRLASADANDAAPGLFEAIQQQLGLKLNAEKAAVDVIVIDRGERPSAN